MSPFVWILGGYFGCVALNAVKQKSDAFNLAKRLTGSRGIVNLGSAGDRTCKAQSGIISNHPAVAANVDIVYDKSPNFVQLDLEQTSWPFNDGQFDVCFASHVLEHLGKWQTAFSEMRRIADYVVIVLPHPFSISGLVNPDHKQHFNFADIAAMRHIPGVAVFC